jgi:FkbM family methyltransferase
MISSILRKLNRIVKGKIWKLLAIAKGDCIQTFNLKDGSTFDYPFNSVLGAHLFMTGQFEEVEMNWVRQILKPGNIVFDVGANGGIYTITASKAVGPTGHVYAFEPGERELDLLRTNVVKNNLSNVTIVNKAISDRKASASFVISRDGAMNSLAKNSHGNQKMIGSVEVLTISIDEFVDEFHIPKVDFMKIDVEGAEHLVFKGMSNTLASNDNLQVLFECCNSTSSGFNYSALDLLGDLKKKGLLISCIDSSSSLVSIDKEIIDKSVDEKIYNFVASKK